MRNTYIFDLDGTLCNIEHRLHLIQRDQPNWDRFFLACENDKPIHETIEVLRALKSSWRICIFSGRGMIAFDRTVTWLKNHEVPFDKLVMRPEGNYDPDEELKWQMLKDHIGEPERVMGIFDDRKKVVDMWRDNGLTCYHVAPGEF